MRVPTYDEYVGWVSSCKREVVPYTVKQWEELSVQHRMMLGVAMRRR